MGCIAHVRNNDDGDFSTQSLNEHLCNVAKLTGMFARKVNSDPVYEHIGYLIGLLHDFGKYQEGFQKYIRKNSGIEPDITANKVYHSRAGAIMAAELTKDHRLSKILSNCISGHHRGLYNDIDLRKLSRDSYAKREKEFAEQGWKKEITSSKDNISNALNKIQRITFPEIDNEDSPFLEKIYHLGLSNWL